MTTRLLRIGHYLSKEGLERSGEDIDLHGKVAIDYDSLYLCSPSVLATLLHKVIHFIIANFLPTSTIYTVLG